MSDQFAIYPSLRDRVVFITGGASGIGAEHVTQFAAQGTKNVSENIAGVRTDADAAAAAAQNVKGASETLESQSQHLGNQVTDFLGKIRAA